MLQVFIRALTTVLTVVVSISITAAAGDTPAGRVLAALVIAALIASIEGLFLWLPNHNRLLRKLLDPRSVMCGVWVQEIKNVSGANTPEDDENRFGIYAVNFVGSDHAYEITGRAYNAKGHEHARWHSIESPSFAKNGSHMTYLWSGSVTQSAAMAQRSAERTGITSLTLSHINGGTGRVDHVAAERVLNFNISRITPAWLNAHNLGAFAPDQLFDPSEQDKLAATFCESLPDYMGGSGH